MKYLLLFVAFTTVTFLSFGQECENIIDNGNFDDINLEEPATGEFFGNVGDPGSSLVPHWYNTSVDPDYLLSTTATDECAQLVSSRTYSIADGYGGVREEAIAQNISMPSGNYVLRFRVARTGTSQTTVDHPILRVTFSRPGASQSIDVDLHTFAISNVFAHPISVCIPSSENWAKIEFRNVYNGSTNADQQSYFNAMWLDDIELINLGVADYPDIAFCPGDPMPTLGMSECMVPDQAYQWSIIGSGDIPMANSATYTLTTVPTATTTYRRTRTLPNGCVFSDDILVDVEPATAMSITASPTYLLQGQSVTMTASGSSSYSWTPAVTPLLPSGNIVSATPTVTTTYTVTGPCGKTASVVVVVESPVSACGSNSGTLLNTAGGHLNSNLSSTFYRVNSSFDVTGTRSITNCVLTIATGAQIRVRSGGLLRIRASHLHSCDDNVWTGIVVEPGGRLIVEEGLGYYNPGYPLPVLKTSMIEDARIAIDILPDNTQRDSVLRVNNTLFNRNRTGIAIAGYTHPQASYPYRIEGSVFTSRNMQTSSNDGMLQWQQTGPLTVQINTFYPTMNQFISGVVGPEKTPKPEGNTIYPSAGLRLTNVGRTDITTTGTATFYGCKIGSPTSVIERNIFDNMQNGVVLTESNFASGYSVYQITANITTTFGIRGNGGEGNYRLEARNDQFSHCRTAIQTNDYYDHLLQRNTVRTRQASTATTLYRGFYIITNRYRQISINDYNTMTNVGVGVHIMHGAGNFNIPNSQGVSLPAYGCYRGAIDVSDNTFQRTEFFSNGATQFFADGIIVECIFGTGGPIASPGILPLSHLSPAIQTNRNKFYGVYRGIGVRNWKAAFVQSNENNPVNLANDPNLGNKQYGISHENLARNFQFGRINEIIQNTITGTGAFNRDNEYAIYSGRTVADWVTCNTVSNSFKGINFDGFHPNFDRRFYRNSMTSHRYGLAVDFNGAIGAQGGSGQPSGNTWGLFGWTNTTGGSLGGSFKVACLGGSDADNSILHVPSDPASPQNPSNSSFAFPINTPSIRYTNGTSLMPASGSLPGCYQSNSFGQFDSIAEDLEIALDGNGQNGYFPDETFSILQKDIYSLVKVDPSLLESEQLSAFILNQQGTPNQQLFDLDQLVSTGNFEAAELMMESIAPQMPDEFAALQYYNCYLNSLHDTLSLEDSILLINLAKGCPFTQGSSVYLARSLYHLLYDNAEAFADDCPEYIASQQKIKKIVEPDDSLKFEVFVHPNPTTDFVNLNPTSPLATKGYSVMVLNMQGQLIIEKTMSLMDGQNVVHLIGNQGFYLFRITNLDTSETVIKPLQVVR